MRTHFTIRVFAAGILFAMLSLSAAAEKRAFIVGVGAYDELTDLQKTEGDAAGYTNLFGNELGYTVTTLGNQKKRRDFVAAFDEFARSITPGDEVVFIFSGHGWSDGGDNYLSFSDAPKGVSEAVLISETVPLEKEVMARLRARGPKVLLAIIDACRDENYDPLTKSNGTLEKGIVRISANEGELILYSAAQGQTSLDRLSNTDPSQYSVFTRVLLPKLRDTSTPLARIANETRSEVQRLAGTIKHLQRPEMMLGIDLDYCLSGDCAGRTVTDQDDLDWQRFSKINTREAFATYLRLHPAGKHVGDARVAMTALMLKETIDDQFLEAGNQAESLNDEPVPVVSAPDTYASGSTGASGGVGSRPLGDVPTPLWNSTLDSLNFMKLVHKDRGARLVETDWQTFDSAPGERLKVIVRFPGNGISRSSLKVSVFRQVYNGVAWVDAEVSPKTEEDLSSAIIGRAQRIAQRK